MLKTLGKLLLLILICGSFQQLQAQLSDLHYLPPLKQGRNNQAIREQSLYLSTPETTAFNVEIYRGTSATPLTTVSLSNATPVEYTLANGDNNITLVDDNSTGLVLTNSGLRLVAPGGQSFYVNYRGRSNSQAASLTSKGRQAMGTEFRWGGRPNWTSHNTASNTLGIMATVDNTTFTLSGYNPACEFRLQSDRDGLTDDSYTFTLDANETFVFEAYNTEVAANNDGWLGARLVSDQPIVISNGGLNMGASATSNSRDAGMDQPVPIDNLGKEYVFVRGNGNSTTETPIIVATQNNTQIFVNGSATAIATINDGEYFVVPESNYSQSAAGGNMYVTTSKDAYAYQSMAGSTSIVSIGLNFVAPMNCLIPDNVNHIPDIQDAAGVTMTGGITIIASTSTPDANIVVTDGTGTITKPASQAITGTADWKTFYIPNLTGNVSVQSTGPVAVGFVGVNGVRGIAGYFSGFDVAPNVNLQITGNTCLPGAQLEVVGEVFDSYQWYGDGNLIPGATATTYTATVAGDYFVRVAKGPCTYDSNNLQVYYCDPDVEVHKTADASEYDEGDTITYTISVTNWAEDPATNLVITDNLPTGISLQSATPTAGSYSAPNWTVGSLISGQMESITLVATIDDITTVNAIGTLVNIASNTQDQTDTNITLDSPSVMVLVHNDSDNDGTRDQTDVDDDNDGIYDTEECTVGESNLALTATASASSTYPGGDASKAIDGDTNGAWSNGSVAHTLNSTANEWITIDLGSPQYVDEIRIWNRTDCCSERLSNAYVFASTTPFPNTTNLQDSFDNATYANQLGNTSGVTQNPMQVSQTIRYIRLQLSGDNTGSGHINIGEIQAIQYIYCDTDTDAIPDHLDSDSDADGCPDSIEAYADLNADGGDGPEYGTGLPPATNADGSVTAATYSTPADAGSNGTPDFQENGPSPSISVQPADEMTLIPANGTMGVTATQTSQYQWQVSTDGGSNYSSIADGSMYSGATSATLTVLNPDLSMDGYLYRVILTNDNWICGTLISSAAELDVRLGTIVTNRRVSFRINPN
jgi:uncharacterized repeat protein (TIGR01451 family)